MTKKLIATDRDGNIVKPGDIITDFRGDKAVFVAATRAPSEGRAGKVSVSGQAGEGTMAMEYYTIVFNLTVSEVDEDTLPLSMILDKNDPDYDLYNDDEEDD
jgi:hypothetical protein